MNKEDTLPYFDADKLLRECLQTIDTQFARLRYSPFCFLPHTKAVVSQGSHEFHVYFPESHTSIISDSNARALTSAIRKRYANIDLRMELCGKMPPVRFVELLQGIRDCGFTVINCHEYHAILQFLR